MTVGVVGLVFQQLAVGYRSSRPAQVHECTKRPELLACTKFVPVHGAMQAMKQRGDVIITT